MQIEAVEEHITVDVTSIDDKKPTINGLKNVIIPKGFEGFFLSNGKDYSAILRKSKV